MDIDMNIWPITWMSSQFIKLECPKNAPNILVEIMRGHYEPFMFLWGTSNHPKDTYQMFGTNFATNDYSLVKMWPKEFAQLWLAVG